MKLTISEIIKARAGFASLSETIDAQNKIAREEIVLPSKIGMKIGRLENFVSTEAEIYDKKRNSLMKKFGKPVMVESKNKQGKKIETAMPGQKGLDAKGLDLFEKANNQLLESEVNCSLELLTESELEDLILPSTFWKGVMPLIKE